MSFIDNIRFQFERFQSSDALTRYSVLPATLLNEFTNKSISLVGNARSLEGTSNGENIDAADMVIRINRAPMPSESSHGTHTDYLALATSLSRNDLQRIKPSRILWMSHKRKRLTFADATSNGFYLHPLSEWETLKETLGAPPTTGLMLINILATSKAKTISLYGFDFFASQSLTGTRTAAQVPHDFTAEKAFVESLLKTDPRFTLVKPT